MSNSRIVYTTESGKVNAEKDQPSVPQGDGVVRIQRITKGRKGKGVSIISGLGLDKPSLKPLCTDLKKTCGCGGAIKGYDIEIQGDVRDKLKAILESKGYKVKLSGG